MFDVSNMSDNAKDQLRSIAYPPGQDRSATLEIDETGGQLAGDRDLEDDVINSKGPVIIGQDSRNFDANTQLDLGGTPIKSEQDDSTLGIAADDDQSKNKDDDDEIFRSYKDNQN